MIDVGIKTIDIQSDVTRLNKRMDGLEVKMDAILEKLDKLWWNDEIKIKI